MPATAALIFVIMWSAGSVCSVPNKHQKMEKWEKFTADFGESYNGDDYDVVYNTSQKKKLLNFHTTGETPQLTVMAPDNTSVLYQGPLKFSFLSSSSDYMWGLQTILGTLLTARRGGQLIIEPSEDDCLDCVDLIENRQMHKDDYQPQNKRERGRSQGFLKKLLNMKNRKIKK